MKIRKVEVERELWETEIEELIPGTVLARGHFEGLREGEKEEFTVEYTDYYGTVRYGVQKDFVLRYPKGADEVHEKVGKFVTHKFTIPPKEERYFQIYYGHPESLDELKVSSKDEWKLFSEKPQR